LTPGIKALIPILKSIILHNKRDAFFVEKIHDILSRFFKIIDETGN
jgi:hypothetical protein